MKLTVLGPGCWGLTLAWLMNDNFEDIVIWGRECDLNDDLVINKHCSKPLEVQLDKKVQITSDLKKAIEGADIILSVVATGGVRPVCEQLKAAGIKPETPLVNASKGLELNTLMRMSEVIKDEKLNMTEAELAKMISVNIPTDTRLISISVNAKTGQDAQTLANKVREVASKKIKKVTKVEDVTTLEEAKLPESPSSPNIKLNVLLGAVLGGFLAVVGVLVREILDDRVRRPEDVEDALGMTLLGIVPDTDKI